MVIQGGKDYRVPIEQGLRLPGGAIERYQI